MVRFCGLLWTVFVLKEILHLDDLTRTSTVTWNCLIVRTRKNQTLVRWVQELSDFLQWITIIRDLKIEIISRLSEIITSHKVKYTFGQ